MTAPFLPEYITARNSSFGAPCPPSLCSTSTQLFQGQRLPCPLLPSHFAYHWLSSSPPVISLLEADKPAENILSPGCTHLGCPFLWWHFPFCINSSWVSSGEEANRLLHPVTKTALVFCLCLHSHLPECGRMLLLFIFLSSYSRQQKQKPQAHGKMN